MRAALAHNNEGVASASCSLLALHFELKLCSGVQPCAGALSMLVAELQSLLVSFYVK